LKTFLFTIIFCLFFSLCVIGQTEPNQENKTVGVEDVYLAKDDGNGSAGDVTTNFLTTDIPIYCIVQLDSMSPVTVKMVFVAVKVKGVKPETKVITASYKTNGKQSKVNFTGTPDGNWVAGNYRVDIFLDNKPARNQVFDIQQGTAQPTEKEKPAAPKNPPTPLKQRNARLVKKKLN
jgi:hypothetical protein